MARGRSAKGASRAVRGSGRGRSGGRGVGQATAFEPYTAVLPSEDALVPAVSATGSVDKRRRLGRRDSDEQVGRLVKDKLENQFRSEVIEGALSKDGKHLVRPYIKAALKMICNEKDSSGKKQNLGTKFWTQFYEDFPSLILGVVAFLPDPPFPPQGVREEIAAALEKAHDPNPSHRSSEQLERVLETLEVDLNETELFGLIQGSEESPVIRRSQALKMQVALMQYFARNVVVFCCLMQGQLH